MSESTSTTDTWFERAIWALVIFAILYIGSHVIVAATRGDFPPTDRPPCMEDDSCGHRR